MISASTVPAAELPPSPLHLRVATTFDGATSRPKPVTVAVEFVTVARADVLTAYFKRPFSRDAIKRFPAWSNSIWSTCCVPLNVNPY